MYTWKDAALNYLSNDNRLAGLPQPEPSIRVIYRVPVNLNCAEGVEPTLGPGPGYFLKFKVEWH